MQEEFGTFSQQLQDANENQERMQKQVEVLQIERDILLEELEKNGSISQQLRYSHEVASKQLNLVPYICMIWVCL